MELSGVPVALYGKFRTVPRARLAARVRDLGGTIARDLTRATGFFVVGAASANLIASGHLSARLDRAARRGIPVLGEARFRAMLAGKSLEEPTLDARSVLPGVPDDALRLLDAFGLVSLRHGKVRFADAQTIRSAAGLLESGHALSAMVLALRDAAAAPSGRRRLVTGPSGDVALEWDDGLTDLAGQGLLPLDPVETVDELFETAMLAEAEGDLGAAERLYALCARADRRDPIAPFNLANMQARRGAADEAAVHYRLALARDPAFAEAEYNLATALEGAGDVAAAEAALERAVRLDKTYADALFNLAQLRLRRGASNEARMLYRRYLATEPPPDWAAKARKALSLIAGSDGSCR